MHIFAILALNMVACPRIAPAGTTLVAWGGRWWWMGRRRFEADATVLTSILFAPVRAKGLTPRLAAFYALELRARAARGTFARIWVAEGFTLDSLGEVIGSCFSAVL